MTKVRKYQQCLFFIVQVTFIKHVHY